MGNTNDNKIKVEPCLYSCDSIIVDANIEFIKFTGFSRGELVGKSLIEIGAMIKITQILLDNISLIIQDIYLQSYLEQEK